MPSLLFAPSFVSLYNRSSDGQLKVVQKGLKKWDLNFAYDGIPDWEKESSVYKNKEKCTS